MSQAEALLNSLTETVIDHTHVVPDSDAHFTIDPYTREIINVSYNKTVLMRGDHNSERFTFELPRYVDGHDMALCNRVMVHFDNVGATIEEVHSDVAYMDDLRVNPDKPDTVISSWLIRREATQIVGILSFSLQYQCVEEGEITYEWNTDSYDEIEIRKSKNNGEAAVINYTNVLEQWRSQIFGAGDSVMTNITTEGANQVAAVQTESATQQAAIELKGSETLATIPEDYTEVYNMASEAVRTKADGIVCEAEGEAIVVSDTSDDYIRGLNVYGKTTQVTTTGVQLFDASQIPTTSGDEVILVNNGDGSFTISAAVTTTTVLFSKSKTYTHEETIKLLKAGNITLTAETTTRPYFYLSLHNSESRLLELNTADSASTTGEILEEWLADSSTYMIVGFFIGANGTVETGTVKPMLYQDGDGTWEPYTGGMSSPNPEYPQELVSVENPTVAVYGKNLLKNTLVYTTLHGVTYSDSGDGDGSFLVNGTPTAYTSVRGIDVDATVFRGKTLYLRGSGTGDVIPQIRFDRDSGLSYASVKDGNEWLELVVPQDAITMRYEAYMSNVNVTADNVKVYPQLSLEPCDYEPYVEQTIALTHTLPGIPVTSGGNYTDSDGQQWFCDEVDFECGVYVQRIGTKRLTSADYIGTSTVYDHTVYAFTVTQRYDTDNYLARTLRGLSNTFRIITDSANFNPGTAIIQTVADNGWGGSIRTKVAFSSDINTEDLVKEYVDNNDVSFYYPLKTPIETSLTAEELETYKSLRTIYPNTTILNDSGAMMKVKYNADTKLYILNNAVGDAAAVVEEVLNGTY